MASAVLERLAGRPDLVVEALGVSWRGRRDLPGVVPGGVGTRATRFPARAAHRMWQHGNWPRFGGFDVVHGPNFVVPPAGGAAELMTIHDIGPWRFPSLVNAHVRAYPRLVDRAIGRGAHVHVPSEFVRKEVVEHLGVEPDRVHMIPNGYEISTGGDPSLGKRLAGRPYVLGLGTIDPRKNFAALIDAMGLVWEQIPELGLVIAGGPGLDSAKVQTAIDRIDPQGRVSMVGYVSDHQRNSLLAGAECLAYPSLYEGFGLPPLEAMSYSTPVVAADAGSLPEVCGDAALLVEPSDHEHLAQSIVDVVTDSALATKLVNSGHSQVQQFSWDKATNGLVKLYQTLRV